MVKIIADGGLFKIIFAEKKSKNKKGSEIVNFTAFFVFNK